MLEAAEPLDRDQHKPASFYMAASSVCRAFNDNPYPAHLEHSEGSTEPWRAQARVGAQPKSHHGLPAHPEGQGALRIGHLLPMSKDALSWAPSEPQEVSPTGSFCLSCRKIRKCHPTAALKRWEKLEKVAFQRENCSAFCNTYLESFPMQMRSSTDRLGQVVRVGPDLALGDCTVQPSSTYW